MRPRNGPRNGLGWVELPTPSDFSEGCACRSRDAPALLDKHIRRVVHLPKLFNLPKTFDHPKAFTQPSSSSTYHTTFLVKLQPPPCACHPPSSFFWQPMSWRLLLPTLKTVKQSPQLVRPSAAGSLECDGLTRYITESLAVRSPDKTLTKGGQQGY